MIMTGKALFQTGSYYFQRNEFACQQTLETKFIIMPFLRSLFPFFQKPSFLLFYLFIYDSFCLEEKNILFSSPLNHICQGILAMVNKFLVLCGNCWHFIYDIFLTENFKIQENFFAIQIIMSLKMFNMFSFDNMALLVIEI